ncbi:MAG: tRNA preQ1(34) S-adenosylmethionine ribosyltransferase-isomerase QueA [Acidiferrobacteraceae bacterium]
MHPSDFRYDLPPELIAQEPLPERSESRLLVLDRTGGALADERFRRLPSLLTGTELLVFNDTRVIAARLAGRKLPDGGVIEILIERILDTTCARAQLRASRMPKPGSLIQLDGGPLVQVRSRSGGFFDLVIEGATWDDTCARLGHVPLPPYIGRGDDSRDRERYQTVFARVPGAVAAPTAGLHFDEPLLADLRKRGVESAFVTLHVGAGTFQPVRVERVEAHEMHAERAIIGEATCERIEAARREGRAVIAVGTTVVRALEGAAVAPGRLQPFSGDLRNFIYPGYSFRIIDGLITNFHLPESTLLMLVCAFAGTSRVLDAYRHAVASGYRFFSYGDAMLIRP